MDLHRMIAELQDERQRLDEAIEALERLSTGTHKRRGRPPKWLKAESTKSAAAAAGAEKPSTTPTPNKK